MKNKKETKKSVVKKKTAEKTKKVSKSVKETVITSKRAESKGPEGSFICPHTGERILKKDCIVDKQKAKTIYFYGTANDSGYNKVHIEKNNDDK